ncbi:MAG: hypothetical protein IGS54_26845 [Elainella sp. C42_A2020_010]|nr:hypothetical protein [Elainella sp. C42_A2020_010]
MQFRASASSLNATKDYTPHPLLLTLWQFVYQRTGLNSALDQLAATLLRTPEPEVNWKTDRYGEPYLEIYDPATKKFHYFTSDQDALIWLERRFQPFL